ncbi:ATPase inhibitor subunit zeta [Rhizobium sp. YIM 134829]|jgi:hypothetical protein|uniref:ATPase inhibitor subunit zeta n=1 Tax=Rhizobium sp. YIM 134829 TaxID=3390453 RepID=UPI00397B897F
MRALKERAQAHETQFAIDQEILFKAEARRNALIGLWAAGALHHPERDAYARQIVEAGVEDPDSVIEKLRADFEAAGVICLEEEIESRMIVMLREIADEMSRS